MANTFELFPYRVHFRAIEDVRFPIGKGGNVFRGAFGTILRDIACVPECPGAQTCPRRTECAYARLFEPALPAPGPSGLLNPPRPFVFRASHLDGITAGSGSRFFVDLHVFEMRFPALPWFQRVFERIAEDGIGPGRGRAVLEAISDRQPAGQPLAISLEPGVETVSRVTVRFVTPTELKAEGELQNEPDFAALFARIRDRICFLSALYGRHAISIDPRAVGERSVCVRTTRVDVKQWKTTRLSTRTKQAHPLGGFVGEIDYEGDVTEFLPWLECACWTGVGRHTVWGNGELRVLAPVGHPTQKP